MLRMQEKLRARAKILENVAGLVKNRNYSEKYWEIINNLYIPGKPRRSRGGKIRHMLVSCSYCVPEVASRRTKYW